MKPGELLRWCKEGWGRLALHYDGGAPLFSFSERIDIWRKGALHGKIQEIATDCYQRRFIGSRRYRI